MKRNLIILSILFLIFGLGVKCFSQTCNPPTATLKVDYSQTANPDICNPAGTALCKPAGETYPNASENQVWSAKIQIPLYCPHPDDPPNSLAAVEFRVDFDKLKLLATDELGNPITQLTAGTAFSNIILNEVNNAQGFIRYAVYALSGQSSPSEVVAFYFKAIDATPPPTSSTTISFVGANCEIAIVADYPGRSIIPPQLLLTNLTVKINDTTAPAIPTWSEPPTLAGNQQIVLSWAPNTDADISRYRVYFTSTTIDIIDPPAKSGFSAQAYVNHPTTTYTHTGLTNDTVKYWYIITAIDASGNGDDRVNRSSSIKWDIPSDIKPPATPGGLTASATYTAGNKKISVTWNKVETRSDGTSLPLTELTGYNVLRASTPLGGNCGTYTKLPTSTSPPIPPQNPQPTTYTYSDTSIFNQTKYCYKVDAQDTGGRRSNPTAGPFNVDFNDPPPPTPTGLAGVAGEKKVDLSWSAIPTLPVNPGVNDDIVGYNLYRASGATEPPDGNFTLVNTSAPITGTTFSNILLTNGTTYWYKITAVDTAPGTPSESARSSAIRVKIPEETPPVLQSATPYSLTRVDLLFNEKLQSSSANTVANYKICSQGQPNCATPALTISAAALQTDAARRTVRLTTSSQTANQSYTVEVRNVADQWANPIPPTSPSTADFNGFAPGTDNVPPVVSSAESTAPTTVIVNFLDQTGIESVSAQTTSNYTICPVENESSITCLTGTLSVSSASCISCSADPLQVSLTTASQLNRWYRVKVINVTDSAPAQNMIVNNNSTNETNFMGTYTEPTLLQLSSARAISNIRVVLTFSKEIGQAGSYTTEPTLTITPTKVEGNQVTLTTSSQTGGTSYTVTATGTTDKSGNVIGSQNRATFEGRPQLSWPYLQDAYSVSSTTVRVEFDRALDQQSAEVSANYEIKDLGGVLLPVSEAKIIPDDENPKTSVRLVTATQKGTEYRLIIKGVKLEGQNVASPEQQRFFTGKGESIITEKPRITSAIAISQTEVIVKYDRKMSTSISVVSNYSISGGLSVVSAVGQSEDKEVNITTTTQRGVDYILSLSPNIKDETGIYSIDTASQSISFRGKDETKPEIRHTPITTAPMGKEIPITATVTDNTQVAWVELHYKRKNEVSFKKEIMALVAGNQYRRTIPATEVTLHDIEYYLVTYDTSGNTFRTNTYTIKGGADKIEITRSDKNVSSITVQVGDIIYLKAKCYSGDNLVNFAGINKDDYKIDWTDKQKKGSIVPIFPQEIRYFPKEKGDEVIEVTLSILSGGVVQKEIKATLDISIDKSMEDIVRIDPEEYRVENLVSSGCTNCRLPSEPIEFPPQKITVIKEDGYRDATKKPLTNNAVFYFNHRTSSAKERGIVNREVRLYDMKGRLVKKLEVRPQDGATFLKASDLPRGIYIYQGVEMDVSGTVIQAEKPKMIMILR